MASPLITAAVEPDEKGHQKLILSAALGACQNSVGLRWASWTREAAQAEPCIVLLHEGLGSIRQWRQLPAALHQATKLKVIAYERIGYGESSPRSSPWSTQFMHEEADFLLPAFLMAQSIKDYIFVGHSDGASIALLAASALRPRALISIAAHVMVEAICREAIDSLLNEERRVNLIGALSKYHTESEQLLRNWSTVWLSQAFSSWDIRERLLSIESPVLAIQARDDAYGTMSQLDTIENHIAQAICLRLEEGGHSPHLSPSLRISERIAEFIQQVHS